MCRKKDIPKSQLRRKFSRCINCNSTNVRFTGEIIDTYHQEFKRLCIECRWIQ